MGHTSGFLFFLERFSLTFTSLAAFRAWAFLLAARTPETGQSLFAAICFAFDNQGQVSLALSLLYAKAIPVPPNRCRRSYFLDHWKQSEQR